MAYNGQSDDNNKYSDYSNDYSGRVNSYGYYTGFDYTYYTDSSGYQLSPENDYELRKEQAIKDNFAKYEERLNPDLHLDYDEKTKALELLAEEDNYQQYTPYGK